MSFQDHAMPGATPQREEMSGWVIGITIFAGMLMILSGGFQIFQGIAAIWEDDFFVLTRSYAFDLDVSTWGWIHVVYGSIVALAGMFLFTGATWARVVAIGIALVSSLINFFYIPYYPIWSLLIIAINVGVIWALALHGKELQEAME